MKILYLINYAGKGGTEKYVRTLIDEFSSRGERCYFAYNENGLLTEQIKDKVVKTFRINIRSAYDLKAAREIADICRENRIDILHTQFPRENFVAVLSKLFYKGTKVFYTNHIIVHNNYLWKTANKIMTHFDDMVFAVCNYGKEVLIENGFEKDKIQVIYNGIQPLENPVESKIRAELNIGSDIFVISALTRYSSEKGLPFLIDTVYELKKNSSKKFVLLIAGDGEMYNEIGEKIKSMGLGGTVIQLGYRNDTANILAGSDMFVNLSSTEALSFAILEALSHGLPVVATDVGGTDDIINFDSECGVLVKYGDTAGAAKEILKIMENDDLREFYSENAVKTISYKFNTERMLNKIMSSYRDMMY